VRHVLVQVGVVVPADGQQEVGGTGRRRGHGDVGVPGGRGCHVLEQAWRDGDPEQGLDLVSEVLGCDLDVEEHRPGPDEAVDPVARRGLGAAENGGEVGHGGAAVPPELGQQRLVLGVEHDRCRGSGGVGKPPAARSHDLAGLGRGQRAGAAVPAGGAAEEGAQHAEGVDLHDLAAAGEGAQ
jgi:hypothetical protein